MLTGTFIAQLKEKNRIEIPAEILTKLDLKEGDKVEVSLKRIRPGKLGIRIARNPLSKLLELAREREKR
ncbi:AbrB/MazE/SpoVT family DNA-binding domain-containing protein [Calditrichota bacterium LG25]